MNQNQHNEDFDLKIEGISTDQLKRNPFQTPDGYFDELTPRIMASIRSSESEVLKPQINWWRVLMPGLGFAAMVLAVWLFSNPNGSDELGFDEAMASISLEELDLYAEFDTEDLLAYGLIEAEDVVMETELTEEEIIDYLIDEEEVELNTIYEEIDI